MRPAGAGAGRLAWAGRLALALLALGALTACGAGRYIPFWGSEDATLLVRHGRAVPLQIWSDGEPLGEAAAGEIACFRDLAAGSRRLRATLVGDTVTLRASRVVLPPEEPMLWDVDHDQLLDGRAHVSLCE